MPFLPAPLIIAAGILLFSEVIEPKIMKWLETKHTHIFNRIYR